MLVVVLCVLAGIKDFMCELCGKTFSERTTLETHKLIHTGKCLVSGHIKTRLKHGLGLLQLQAKHRSL